MSGSSILGNSRKPDIVVRNDGTIEIMANVSSELGIEHGDIIDIWKSGCEYYLYVKLKASDAVGLHVARCRKTGRKSRHMRVSCRRLADYILSAVGARGEAFLTAGPAVQIEVGMAKPIITRMNLKSACHD